MIYLYSFLFTGIICMIAEVILDSTNLTPGHITSIFVIVGSFLDIFSIYDKIIIYVGGGALVPITSFGHLLSHGAMESVSQNGLFGLFMGMFNMTSSGICAAIIFSFYMSLIFKPKS